jgi:GNAT superfamily N-acetyltransferase
MLPAPAPIDPRHELGDFNCGVDSLNLWLRRRARANQASGASRTFVLCEGQAVIGYYALASSAVFPAETSGRFRRNIPDPVPVVVLGRLAVATSHRGRGLGRALFQDAASKLFYAADVIGIRGMVVHALSAEAHSFYRSLGLESSPLDPMMLMVTVADLRANQLG